jgi:N-acetylglutamate synthase-like GNAT family acetyltransferase
MTFEVIPFTKEHYEIYASWLESRGRPVPKYEYLSDRGRVIVADGRPVAAGFAFSVGKLCAIGNLASDPVGNGRSDAVEALLDELLKVAKNGGQEMVAINTNKRKLMERLEKRGFVPVDRDLVQYTRAL